MNDAVRKSLDEFKFLKSAIIDTSSIIYMKNIRIFDLIANQIKLMVPEQVVSELGYDLENIEITKVNKIFPGKTDNIIFETAKWYNYTIISEDKMILQQAEKANLPYFNTLMMLNFLYFKNRISESEYLCYAQKLKSVARYSHMVWEYGNTVFDVIRKLA